MERKEYKFKPFTFEKVKYKEGTVVPIARSGHRIVTTDSELYSFGGFNPHIEDTDPQLLEGSEWDETKPMFRELWRFSFITREWTRLPVVEHTPKELASHCAKLIGGKHMLTYGGTGFPFGQTSSNKLFVYNIETNEWKRIEAENSDQNDCPTERYGQALAIDQSNDLYIVGGTDGYHYSIDVHKFDVKTRHWCQLYHKNNNEIQEFPGERYRHEMVFHDNKLIVFGGGTSYGCFSLESLPVFDLKTLKWIECYSKSDLNVEEGYPPHRRCHDCVQIDNQVFLFGGTNGLIVFDDLWKLELDSLQWTLLSPRIPQGLYFHSAYVSPSGRLSIFGGVVNTNHRERTNDCYNIWLKIPDLKEMAFEAILFYIRDKSDKSVKQILYNLKIPVNFRQRLK